MTGQAEKSHDGHGGEEDKRHSGRQVTLQRQALQCRNAVGNEDPDGEHESKTDAGIYTGADGRGFENVEPAIAREGSTNGNQNHLQNLAKLKTRIYEEGGVTSGATVAECALSFRERSTAVTENQFRV